MKVVFLGSFDPPTNGHVHLISEALSNGASEVLMIPAWRNPWKSRQSSYNHRVEMCKLVSSLYPPGKVRVMRREGKLAKDYEITNINVPSWLVLKNLKETIGDFKILTTNETYSEIPDWIMGDEILREYNFMILSSPHLGKPIQGSIEIDPLPISSTLVRGLLVSGIYCPEYLPTPVMEYIRNYQLYI